MQKDVEKDSRRCRNCTTIEGDSPVSEIFFYALSVPEYHGARLNPVGSRGDQAPKLNISTYR